MASLKRTQLLTKSMIFNYTKQNPSLYISNLKNPVSQISQRNYISEMRKPAFEGNILRLLRNEIQYELERSSPKQLRNTVKTWRKSNCSPSLQSESLIGVPKLKTHVSHQSHSLAPIEICQTRSFCKNPTKDNSNGDKIESNVNSYHDAYKQLDKLDFSTAAKILFTDPPKKKQFGIDFHLVQLFFVCMPSLAVYLVAQYARYEMRRMEAELEQKKAVENKKKQEEEEKAKELELREAEEKAKSNPELLEVKRRLGKLEEVINEIVVESKNQSGGTVSKKPEDDDEKKLLTESEPGDTRNRSGSSRCVEKDLVGKPNSGEPTTGKTKMEGPSEYAKR